MSQHDSLLELPREGRILSQAEVDEAYRRAFAAYERNRAAIEREFPEGTLILMDGDDESGKTFTPGDDMAAVEQKHYRTHRKPLHSACFFRVGHD